ncbi:hypothetical protein BDZ45DRAFT_699992 [Acephala macrosclerotiorum]|nr:hypothetical protein BDZ45DRAFT_699992 [Acephala macrosclerotiorum]
METINPADCLVAGFMLKQRESSSELSDGEIYWNIRYYQKQNNNELAQYFMLRLSPWKQRHLKQMFRHNYFIKAFDELLCYPGLWSGFELGNIRRHLALRCHEELLSYLKHVYITWEEITQHDPLVCRAVDIYTVQNLQMRAPLASSIDRDYIIQGFDNWLIFSQITNVTLREKIKQTILQLPVLIPTIKSFHENVKYLEIAAKIIKKQLFANRLPFTIYQALSSIWKSTGRAIVEVREGEFKFVQISTEDSIRDIAYVQVFLSAFRDFPELSYDAPRKEKGEEVPRGMPNDTIIYQSLKRVQLLGFHSAKIDQKINEFGRPSVLNLGRATTTWRGGESLKRRWGRPFEGSYKYFRERLFLGRAEQLELDVYPSIMFVQQDLLAAFFGYTSVNFQATTTAELASIPTQQLPTWRTYASMPECHEAYAALPTSSTLVPPTETNPDAEITQPVPAEASATEPTGLVEDYGPPRDTAASPDTVATIETIIPLDTMASPEYPSFRALTWMPSEMQDLTSQLINTAMEVDGVPPSQEAQALAYQGQHSHNEYEAIQMETSIDALDQNSTSPVDADTAHSFADEIVTASDAIVEATHDVMPEPELETGEAVSPKSMSETSAVVGTIEGVDSMSETSTVVGTIDADLPTQTYDQTTVASQNRRPHLKVKSRRPSPVRGSKRGRSYLAPNAKPVIPQNRFPIVWQGRRGKLLDSRIPRTPIKHGAGRSQELSQSRRHLLAESNNLQQGVQGTTIPFNRFQGRRSYLPSTNEMLRSQTPQIVEFIEHNGMTGSLKATRNIADHLQQRKGWVGMIIEREEAKTIRFEHIVGYIANGNLGESRTLALVKESYAETFRANLVKQLRYIDGRRP